MFTPENNFSPASENEPTAKPAFPVVSDFTSLRELFQKGQQYSPKAYAELIDQAMWWLVEYRDCLGAEFAISENYWMLRELRDAFSKMK